MLVFERERKGRRGRQPQRYKTNATIRIKKTTLLATAPAMTLRVGLEGDAAKPSVLPAIPVGASIVDGPLMV
jgi:hypothetical protein